ncbi:MAG: dipeptidyl-peptidase 4 [bacterium P3]|nr:MAG: dipeptidyl-peptidase 4 [bacterium P3]KWW38718.1 MAG: dipeptidyl-peptidase 4 [bacterium F083]
MKRFLLFSFLATALLPALAQSPAVPAQGKSITLEDIWTNRTFAPHGIRAVQPMNDGEHYCVLTATGVDCYSYASGERQYAVCFFQEPGAKAKVRPLPPIESYAFDAAERQLLLSSGYEPIYRHSGKSDYYLYNIETKTFTQLSKGGKQRLTTFSPDGTKVAFVRDNNLFYMDLATLQEHRITTDGAFNKIIYGTTDWVYEEEFSITEGFSWSPDSRRIAFYRFDESRVKEYEMQMWGELYPDGYRYKYPKAGEDNSVVDIWIYDLDGDSVSRPALGSENDQYLPRFQWTADPGRLAVMRLNRLQNRMELLLVDAATLEVTPLYTEEDPAYVEVPDTWRFLADGKHFLITSEQSGYNHVYLYDMKGRMVRQITTGDYDVVSVCGIDEQNKRIYYTSHESSPVNTDFYSIGFDGKKKKCLSPAEGTYAVTMGKGCKYYFESFSTANTAPVFSIRRADGSLVKTVEGNTQLQARMEQYGANRKEFGYFTTSQGTELNYYIILPPDFDSTQQYPLFFYVYGGPGNQQVRNAYDYYDNYWFHMLSQKGYVVVCFDGRGTGGRGAAFKKQTYRDLGRMECEDAIEAARYFGAQPWIDAARIGIFGWSFGGYLSTLAILKGNDVFKAAIAVAPVTSWRFYDNIYTERFLQRPQDNPEGYDDNSPLLFADRLQGDYLLVHGTGDDNVHFQNTAAMAEALERAGKQFEMRIYPNKNHSILGARTRLNLYELMTDFLLRKL